MVTAEQVWLTAQAACLWHQPRCGKMKHCHCHKDVHSTISESQTTDQYGHREVLHHREMKNEHNSIFHNAKSVQFRGLW